MVRSVTASKVDILKVGPCHGAIFLLRELTHHTRRCCGLTHRGGQEERRGGSRPRDRGEDNSEQECGDPVKVSHYRQRKGV